MDPMIPQTGGLTGWLFRSARKKKAQKAANKKYNQDWIANSEANYGFSAGAEGDSLVDAGFQNGKFNINARKTASQLRNRELADYGSTNALEALSQFDPATAGDRAEEAYRTQATGDFMNTFNPMVQKMQNQIGQRFGTFNNTNFNDNWQKMNQQTLTPALARISQDAIMNRGQFVQNEMNPLLQLLNTYNLQVDNDINDTMRKITMGSQGYAQGQDAMRSNPLYQDRLRQAGWAAPLTANKGIDWGSVLGGAASAFAKTQGGG